MAFFASTLSALTQWCRSLRHGLGAGLSIVRVFELQAKKGPLLLRDVASRLAERLKEGDSLEDALEPESHRLPKLFRQLVSVGERTGHLPEIFGELGEYYELQQKISRDFRAQITWPVIQFFVAILVISFLIYILGLIGAQADQEPIAPIGFGLTGGRGAAIFLLAVGIFLGSLFALYLFIKKGVSRRTAFEAFLLKVPVIGPCVQSLALGRFCLALRMTLETGMPTEEALRHSLRATDNAAFADAEDRVAARIRAGDEIHEALLLCTAIPEEFRETLAVAEVSGQIPEIMIRQAVHYREESARRLKMLATFAGHGVWAFVAILIIWAIFRIAGVYIGHLNQV